MEPVSSNDGSSTLISRLWARNNQVLATFDRLFDKTALSRLAFATGLHFVEVAMLDIHSILMASLADDDYGRRVQRQNSTNALRVTQQLLTRLDDKKHDDVHCRRILLQELQRLAQDSLVYEEWLDMTVKLQKQIQRLQSQAAARESDREDAIVAEPSQQQQQHAAHGCGCAAKEYSKVNQALDRSKKTVELLFRSPAARQPRTSGDQTLHGSPIPALQSVYHRNSNFAADLPRSILQQLGTMEGARGTDSGSDPDDMVSDLGMNGASRGENDTARPGTPRTRQDASSPTPNIEEKSQDADNGSRQDPPSCWVKANEMVGAVSSMEAKKSLKQQRALIGLRSIPTTWKAMDEQEVEMTKGGHNHFVRDGQTNTRRELQQQQNARECFVRSEDFLESLLSEDNTVLRAYRCVRMAAFLRKASQSGLCLLDTLLSQTKGVDFERTARDATSLAKLALSELSREVKKKQLVAFSDPVNFDSLLEGGSRASFQYGQLLHIANDLSWLVSRENLCSELAFSPSNLREGILVTFRQHWMVCDRLITHLDHNAVSCLEPCLCCLHGIASSVPLALQPVTMLRQDVQELVYKLAQALAVVARNVGQNLTVVENGISETHVAQYHTLRAGLWFDRWLKDVASETTLKLQRGQSFRKAFVVAYRLYCRHYNIHWNRLADAFENLLSEESSSEIVEDSVSFIVESWDEFLSCWEIVKVDEGHQHTPTVLEQFLVSRLQDWCTDFNLKFIDGVCGLPFERINRVLQVARGLRDVEFRGIRLQSFASWVADKLKDCHKSMVELMQDNSLGQAKASLLDLAQSWSKFPMLQRHLPVYEQLRGVAIASALEHRVDSRIDNM